ncbi:zinc finger, CCHC-type containing protein, partial [Tanacetum coccineum]
AVVRLPDSKLKTLGERGIECIFVGYAEHSKAFRFSLVPRPSLSIPKGTENIGGLVVPEVVTDEEQGMRSLANTPIALMLKMIPKPFDEAMKSQDVAFWKEAINDEMDSIMGNNTWVLADLPPDGCETAFLNGDLDEEVYMNQPQGFIMPGNENKVCKLIKSLYGLKQAPKQWHQNFNEVVLSNGYLLNQADKCVYSKFDESGKGVIICLYVDDMMVFSIDQVQVDLTNEFLSSKFSMKDMGEADVILGIRIKHESNRIAIYQSYYIEKLHQLHLDEEALRETLEEQAMDEKAREEKIRQKQADDDEFFMEFGVVRYDSEYESSG